MWDAARLGRDSTATPIRWRAAMSAPRSTRRPSRRFTRSGSRSRPRDASRHASSSPAAAKRARAARSYRDHTVRRGETVAGRHAREGALRARRDGAAARRARLRLGRHHRRAGLHRARPASVPGRRDRAPRRRARRADLALLPAAGAGPRLRDGLPRRSGSSGWCSQAGTDQRSLSPWGEGGADAVPSSLRLDPVHFARTGAVAHAMASASRRLSISEGATGTRAPASGPPAVRRSWS